MVHLDSNLTNDSKKNVGTIFSLKVSLKLLLLKKTSEVRCCNLLSMI